MKDESKATQARPESEHRKAERVLKESEESGWTILENIQEGYYEVDLAGNYTFFNSFMSKILGYTKEEMMGMNYRLYTDKENTKKIFYDFNEVYRTGIPSNVEYEQIRKDGSKMHVETSVALMRDSLGQPTGFRGIVRDITERKRAEEALRKNEEFFRAIIENASDIVLVVNRKGRIIYTSPSVEHILGYKPEDLIGKSSLDLIAPADAPRAIDDFSKAISTSSILVPNAFRIRHKDGTERFLEGVGKNLSGNPSVAGFVMNVRDVTERKQAEEKLALLSQQNLLILCSVAEGIIGLDSRGKHMFVNPAAARMLGYGDTELLGRSSHTIWHHTKADGSPYPKEECQIYVAYREGIVHRSSAEVFWRKDGTSFPVEYASTPIYEHDRLSGAVVTFSDITERKRVEESLKETLGSLRKAVGATIQVLAFAVEVRDPYTAGHQLRVANLARTIATEMGLPYEKIEAIRVAGSIHDIGKLSIPADILSKPTKLSEIEFSLIKEHPSQGYEILKNVESPWPLAEIVYQHHELLDGSGYPRKLRGEEILIEARILTVADVVEAMASHRPYRPGLGIDAALNEIEKNSGIFYDNAVADACLRLFREKGFQLAMT